MRIIFILSGVKFVSCGFHISNFAENIEPIGGAIIIILNIISLQIYILFVTEEYPIVKNRVFCRHFEVFCDN